MTNRTQRHELTAWLGDDHNLTSQQIDDLLTIAHDIDQRYPDPDDQPQRDAALAAAYRLMSDDDQDYVVDSLADDLVRAREAEAAALAGIQQAARQLIPTNDRWSENGFATQAGVDRMAVRKWLGKRS